GTRSLPRAPPPGAAEGPLPAALGGGFPASGIVLQAAPLDGHALGRPADNDHPHTLTHPRVAPAHHSLWSGSTSHPGTASGSSRITTSSVHSSRTNQPSLFRP